MNNDEIILMPLPWQKYFFMGYQRIKKRVVDLLRNEFFNILDIDDQRNSK